MRQILVIARDADADDAIDQEIFCDDCISVEGDTDAVLNDGVAQDQLRSGNTVRAEVADHTT